MRGFLGLTLFGQLNCCWILFGETREGRSGGGLVTDICNVGARWVLCLVAVEPLEEARG